MDRRDLIAAWDAARQGFVALIQKAGSYQGKLGTDAATLRGALQAQSDAALKVSRLLTYASLKADEDVRIAANQERKQIAMDLYGKFGEAVSFTSPELLTVGKVKVEGFLAADSGFRLRIRSARPRTPWAPKPSR